MNFKSYLVEKNIEILKNNLVLFYGENSGLIKDFKKLIQKKYIDLQILKFNQDELLSNSNIFFKEIRNISLFDDKKIFFIDSVNDKIFKIVEEISTELNDNKVYLFANVLDKKSKLRIFFEKEERTDIVPCYQDNELTIKNIILKKLNNYSGLTPDIINTITENCNNDRAKLQNELEKIIIFFNNNQIDMKNLKNLLNTLDNDDFNLLKDSALKGNKNRTNKLLDYTNFEIEKCSYYLSILNQRLMKLLEAFQKKTSIENAINEIRPPIFWKDKPDFLYQAKLWNKEKINKALKKTYEAEINIKSTDLDKKVIIKKLLVDVCCLANAS